MSMSIGTIAFLTLMLMPLIRLPKSKGQVTALLVTLKESHE